MTGPTAVGMPALEALAYSQDPAESGAVSASGGVYGWRWVLERAALLLVLAGVLAGGIVVVGYPLSAPAVSPAAPPQAPPSPAPPAEEAPAAAVAPPVAPPDVDHQLAGDAWYLSMVNAGLVPAGRSVSNPAGSIDDGHRVCGYIAEGHTAAQTVDEVVVGLPATMPAAQARTIAEAVVGAAVRAYCPLGGRP